MQPQEPLAFISYRRADSSAASRWLAQSVARTFGAQRVFIDTESIRTSDDWVERINEALSSATLLVPVMGAAWFSVADKYNRRRIDNEDDWVRREIRYALDSKLAIMPVLLSGTRMPEPLAFPESIAKLSRFRAAELRDDHWESDLRLLLARMEELGFRRVSTNPARYPSPRVSLRDLTEGELRVALNSLPEWKCVSSDFPGMHGVQSYELYRAFEFASFEDAMAFMNAAVPEISRRQHHPRWENVWRTVSVWLSTWDIGHKPSELDVALADYLDNLAARYPQPRRRQ
ncbi:4a-hydroxytetrahydrobiopterin dehydratase [Burkholderia sp. F1]|uniref:4a-hydroxytetrahydrobiopterin dehydratase n=1 Tax=Burkholderia sp. F1 TaxID=3366817 RepID=UPI003D761735